MTVAPEKVQRNTTTDRRCSLLKAAVAPETVQGESMLFKHCHLATFLDYIQTYSICQGEKWAG